MSIKPLPKTELNVPKALDRFFSKMMKQTIQRLHATESLVSTEILTSHLARLSGTLKRLDSILRDDFREGIDTEKAIKTRNTVLGDVYFDPAYPFKEVKDMPSRLCAKGVLDSVMHKNPGAEGSAKRMYVLDSKWKVPIADIIIGCAAFAETASNAPLGCQRHAHLGHLIGDASCAECFRSSLHKMSSDAFNHFIMFRCIVSAGLKDQQSIDSREPRDVEGDFPHLCDYLRKSPLSKRKVRIPITAKKLGFGSERKGPTNHLFTNLRNEFESYAENHLASGWTWIVFDMNSNAIKVMNTPSTVSILSFGMWPLVALDLWEHAYIGRSELQKDVKNSSADAIPALSQPTWGRAARRAKQGLPPLSTSSYTNVQPLCNVAKKEYIQRFWGHIDWSFVEEQVTKAMKWKENHDVLLITQDAERRKLAHEAKTKKKAVVEIENVEHNADEAGHAEDDDHHSQDAAHEEMDSKLSNTEDTVEHKTTNIETANESVADLNRSESTEANLDTLEKELESDEASEKTQRHEEGVSIGSAKEESQELDDSRSNEMTEEDLWSEIYEKSFASDNLTEKAELPRRSGAHQQSMSEELSDTSVFEEGDEEKDLTTDQESVDVTKESENGREK